MKGNGLGLLELAHEAGEYFRDVCRSVNECPFYLMKTLSGEAKNISVLKAAKVGLRELIILCDRLKLFIDTYLPLYRSLL
jgi:hypothetical protein